mmetsp:Transcript_175347/g.562466  ORF Transcript_175347/g.562466 Transcript_175347/m.562466 type:complete len:460 (+) Transcript_175347:949-2328(+)
MLLLCAFRDARQEVLGHGRDDLLGGLAAAARGDAGLHADDRVQELFGLIELRRDLSIRVESKDARILVHRQGLQVCPCLVQRDIARRVIPLQACKPEAFDHHLGTEIALEDRGDESHILVVCDAASIVDLGDDVSQRGPRDLRLSHEVHPDLLTGHLEVGVHPLVGDVPPDGAELPPLEDDGVEEGQAEEQVLVLEGLRGAGLEDVLADVLERSAQVRSETLGRLVGDLDAVLQDGHREEGRRHTREPQPVLFADLFRILRLLDLLEFTHPTGRQVTILQAHPVTGIPAQLDQGFGLGSLTLAEGDEVEAVPIAPLHGQLQQVLGWICAGGEHEDQRSDVHGVVVARAEVKGGRLDKEGAQLGGHEVARHERQEILAQGLDDDHLLEGRQLGPPPREDLVVHVIAPAELLPSASSGNVLHQALESRLAVKLSQSAEHVDLCPSRSGHVAGARNRRFPLV